MSDDPAMDDGWFDDDEDDDLDLHEDDDEDDDLDLHEDDCALMADGNCGNAGTEWCDWSCPLNHERNANRIRKMKRKNQTEMDL